MSASFEADSKLQIDTLPLTWAVHDLGGVSSPANAAYSADELVYQIKSSSSKALFTCLPLLQTSITAAERCGIPRHRIYLFDLPKEIVDPHDAPSDIKTINQLVRDAAGYPPEESLKWTKGQGATQTAFLCYSSGTSGLPVCQESISAEHC